MCSPRSCTSEARRQARVSELARVSADAARARVARRRAGGALLAAALACGPARAAEPGLPAADAPVCRLIEASARDHGLPVGFLTRLIWRESSFRPAVISPAGAQGIAQFMPSTAGERGSFDPFDPEAAVPKAAELLADLDRRFGNLGLAAAAYNAGGQRVADWLAGRRELPGETRAYVLAVTGRPADDWKGAAGPAAPPASSCANELALLRVRLPDLAATSPLLAPWGVQLAGSISKVAAVAAYARRRAELAVVLRDEPPMVIGGRAPGRGFRPFWRVRFPAPSRSAATAMCDRILRLGGACSVTRT